MRGWHVRLVVAVISRVVTVLVGAALVLEVIIAMTMIVLIRGRPSMRVCSRTQGCVRQGCCAREREQGMREHQQPNQHSRQREHGAEAVGADVGPRAAAGVEGDAIVPHGFRSTFRDWCAEVGHYPRELAEHALAHSLPSRVEAAYHRGTMLERRAPMMQAWGNYIDGAKAEDTELIPLNAAA